MFDVLYLCHYARYFLQLWTNCYCSKEDPIQQGWATITISFTQFCPLKKKKVLQSSVGMLIQSFDNGHVGKQPVARKEYCTEFWSEDFQESMGRCTGCYDVSEIMFKTALNTIQQISYTFPMLDIDQVCFQVEK